MVAESTTFNPVSSMETIEFRPHPTGGPIGNRREPDDAPFVAIEVPKAIADACRKLDHRRQHGAHISTIGGIDALGEFALHGIPVVMKAFRDRSTRANECWAIPRADFRFPANGVAA